MSELRNVILIIESVQGESPGLAAQISYTCTIVFEGGERREGQAGIVPTGRRWQSPIKIDAAPPRGTVNEDGSIEEGMWPGVERGPEGATVLTAWINELPHCEPCK